MKLLICTHNENKIKEIKDKLASLPISIISLIDLKDNETVEENGLTFRANALIKARYYGDKYNMIALGDDTGLEVLALGGGPGVFTNRYETTPERRNMRLLSELKEAKDRTARFKTSMALYVPKTGEIYYFEGSIEGEITKEPKGTQGFGYDPLFYVKELGKTMAEVDLSVKNEISHRGLALTALKEFLNETINYFWYP